MLRERLGDGTVRLGDWSHIGLELIVFDTTGYAVASSTRLRPFPLAA